MKSYILLLISILHIFATNIQGSTKGEIGTLSDDISSAEDSAHNIIISQKKDGWFKRTFRNIDKVLSPERDSNYIDVQKYNWCAMAQISSRFENYDIDSGEDFTLQVTPSTWRTRIGPFFGWRWAFFGYNIDLKSVFVNSHDTDLGASIYSAAFGVDAFYRRVGGDYNIKQLNVSGKDYSNLLRGTPFGGINIGMTRVSLYYVTNYKHYSHQAAFSQTNRQLRSAGSPILGLSYAHNKQRVDWESLNKIVNQNASPEEQAMFTLDYETQKNDEFSAMAGYGYNWVFAKNFLAAAEFTGALGYLKHKYKFDNTVDEENGDFLMQIDNFYKSNIALNANIRLALLYNNGPWFAGDRKSVV